jgi:hypothetical protein
MAFSDFAQLLPTILFLELRTRSTSIVFECFHEFWGMTPVLGGSLSGGWLRCVLESLYNC